MKFLKWLLLFSKISEQGKKNIYSKWEIGHYKYSSKNGRVSSMSLLRSFMIFIHKGDYSVSGYTIELKSCIQCCIEKNGNNLRFCKQIDDVIS